MASSNLDIPRPEGPGAEHEVRVVGRAWSLPTWAARAIVGSSMVALLVVGALIALPLLLLAGLIIVIFLGRMGAQRWLARARGDNGLFDGRRNVRVREARDPD